MGLAGPVVALALAAVAAGCGGDDSGAQIPQENADQMLATAQEIEQASSSQECDTAKSGTTDLRGQVDELEGDVDGEIYDALSQMVSRLDEQLDSECAETGTSEPETTETTETVAPEPTTTTPTETTTTTTEPAPEEEEEEAPAPEPPGQGGGGGGQGPSPTPPGQSGGAPPTGGTEEGG